jgi:hypothetical protein
MRSTTNSNNNNNNLTTMDLTEALKGLASIQSLLPAIQEQLKEKAVQEAVDGGAAVAVRPWSFRHPLKGETDPWFGLAYQDWLAMRNEGFDGTYTPNDPSSGRAKLMIIYDEAVRWLQEKARAQKGTLADRSADNERLRQAQQQNRKEAA